MFIKTVIIAKNCTNLFVFYKADFCGFVKNTLNMDPCEIVFQLKNKYTY